MILDARTLGRLDLGKLEEALRAAISDQLKGATSGTPEAVDELSEINDTLKGYVAASYATTKALESLQGKVSRVLQKLRDEDEEEECE